MAPERPETRKGVDLEMDTANADELVRADWASLDRQAAPGGFTEGEMDALLAAGERSGAPLEGEQVLAELADLRRH